MSSMHVLSSYAFQYSLGRTRCPLCTKRGLLVFERPLCRNQGWVACLSCGESGSYASILNDNPITDRFQDLTKSLQSLLRTELQTHSATTELRALLGIPFRKTDLLRRVYDPLVGYGTPQRAVRYLRRHGMRLAKNTAVGIDLKSRDPQKETPALTFPLEQYPGLILGFGFLTPDGLKTIRIDRRTQAPVRIYIRLSLSERHRHFSSIGEALTYATDCTLLNIPCTITADPVFTEFKPGVVDEISQHWLSSKIGRAMSEKKNWAADPLSSH
jgi:hypothetical protein